MKMRRMEMISLRLLSLSADTPHKFSASLFSILGSLIPILLSELNKIQTPWATTLNRKMRDKDFAT